MSDKKTRDYLHDGAYVMFDGYRLWVLANSLESPTGRVALDTKAFRKLIEFAILEAPEWQHVVTTAIENTVQERLEREDDTIRETGEAAR